MPGSRTLLFTCMIRTPPCVVDINSQYCPALLGHKLQETKTRIEFKPHMRMFNKMLCQMTLAKAVTEPRKIMKAHYKCLGWPLSLESLVSM